jgi:hypothetical protein
MYAISSFLSSLSSSRRVETCSPNFTPGNVCGLTQPQIQTRFASNRQKLIIHPKQPTMGICGYLPPDPLPAYFKVRLFHEFTHLKCPPNSSTSSVYFNVVARQSHSLMAKRSMCRAVCAILVLVQVNAPSDGHRHKMGFLNYRLLTGQIPLLM